MGKSAGSSSGLIRERDARQILRLAGEVFELPPDPELRRQHLAHRLAEITNAKVVFYAFALSRGAGKPVDWQIVSEGGWLSPKEREILQMYWSDAHAQDPAWLAMQPHCDKPLTCVREQLLTRKEWYGSKHFNEYRRISRLDPFIYASRRIRNAQELIAFGVNREIGDKQFTRREYQIMRLVIEELGWLHRSLFPTPAHDQKNAELSPRLHQTLERLLAGDAEKQIAARLKISPHTVHQYVKALYRRFGVSTRAELLATCLSSAGAIDIVRS